MKTHKFNFEKCNGDLIAFKSLLDKNRSLDEPSLLSFFRKRPNLIYLMGRWANFRSEYYTDECSIVNEFRADFAVADKLRKQFVFVEFEDARPDSVFKNSNGRRIVKHEWSRRFEHGYSQVIDWYYRISDYERTDKLEEHFLSKKFSYVGLIVIGRREYVVGNALDARLKWRSERSLINNLPFSCMTFDDFYDELNEKYLTIKADREGKLNKVNDF